jgi:hypothetical protein
MSRIRLREELETQESKFLATWRLYSGVRAGSDALGVNGPSFLFCMSNRTTLKGVAGPVLLGVLHVKSLEETRSSAFAGGASVMQGGRRDWP